MTLVSAVTTRGAYLACHPLLVPELLAMYPILLSKGLQGAGQCFDLAQHAEHVLLHV